jgi:hypothetical protein
MARQQSLLNYSAFGGGILTEASPLTFPDGASIDERNFILTKQGTRERRKGLDKISKETLISENATDASEITSYLWQSDSSTQKDFLVVTVKNELFIYDLTDSKPGDSVLYRTTVGTGNTLSVTSHTGQLIVASGDSDLTLIKSLGGNLFSEAKQSLRIRDRVGLPTYPRKNANRPVVDMNTAEGASLRVTSNDLYLSPQYKESETPGAQTGTTVVGSQSYTFDKTAHQFGNRYILDCDCDKTFMGYPVDAFLVDKEGSAAYIYMVFKKPFYIQTIVSNYGNMSIHQGVMYRCNLTLAQYETLKNGQGTLTLNEQAFDNHPHTYNLWNQGWGYKRMGTGDETLDFPIDMFTEVAGKLPAASDSVEAALYADSQDEQNRTADRFHPEDLVANPQGSMVSPQGRYIIDALKRGESREEAWKADMLEQGYGRTNTTRMNYESTGKGCTTVAEYAGRVWFAGFSEDTAGSTLPLANKILYGQMSDDNLLSCYQEADPTSVIDSELVDTDGGWISIDAIDKVIKLVPTDASLLVFANNGVWVIAGGDGNTFTPTSSMVLKITDRGCVSPQSIVSIDKDVYFWAEDGLYRLISQGFATYTIESLTKPTINEIIISLNKEDMKGISGAYDERTETISWIIDSGIEIPFRRELVFHMSVGSFTLNTLYAATDKEVLGIVRTPSFEVALSDTQVYSDTLRVISGVEDVVVNSVEYIGKRTNTTYLGVERKDGNYYIFFADTVRKDFKDFGEVDATAYLITGYVSGGDTTRFKTVPQMVAHFNRTETTATEEGVNNPSGCTLQVAWEWTNDPYANKWGKPIQLYRLPRPQIRGINEEVAEGIQVVTTRNKLRGRGRVLSLMFNSQEGKDCQLIGWAMMVGSNANV